MRYLYPARATTSSSLLDDSVFGQRFIKIVSYSVLTVLLEETRSECVGSLVLCVRTEFVSKYLTSVRNVLLEETRAACVVSIGDSV